MAFINKRGQSAAGAAVLLAVIAGILIMFIVMAPPAQRAEILGETVNTSSTTLNKASTVQNLLVASPGRIDYLATNEIEHPLPAVNVYTQMESKILAEKNTGYAKRGVFYSNDITLKFDLQELADTEKALLNFKVISVKGKIIVSLNGEEVFNSAVDTDNPVTVSLPKSSLKEENELLISATSPGLAFWSTNEIQLESLKVVGEVTNKEAQYAKETFLVSKTEKSNLEKAVLKFQPDCKVGEAGKLKVSINLNEIYEGFPDCDLAMIPIEFSPSSLQEGENQLNFMVEKGTYALSHIFLISKLKEVDYPIYYFDLSYEQYQEVQNEEKKVRLKVEFVDIAESNGGVILVNGHFNNFDTKETSLLIDISEDVVQGKNAVKLKPKKTMDVRELKVDLIK